MLTTFSVGKSENLPHSWGRWNMKYCVILSFYIKKKKKLGCCFKIGQMWPQLPFGRLIFKCLHTNNFINKSIHLWLKWEILILRRKIDNITSSYWLFNDFQFITGIFLLVQAFCLLILGQILNLALTPVFNSQRQVYMHKEIFQKYLPIKWVI